jgi:general secretion pathway protein B
MSFILDALKKSELERQRQSMPGLIDVPVAPRRRGLPVWAIVLAGLLIINAIVIAVLLLRGNSAAPVSAKHSSPPASEPPAAPAPKFAAQPAVPQTTPAAANPDHFSPLDAAPVYAPEVPVDEAPARADTARTAAQPTITESAPPSARSARRSDPILSEPDTAEDTEILPSMSELNLSGPQALSELHLDVHVYATHAVDRFVYINMRKYHEGATLQEGPTLEHIRRDGVVLSYHGVRFLLPRQS